MNAIGEIVYIDKNDSFFVIKSKNKKFICFKSHLIDKNVKKNDIVKFNEDSLKYKNKIIKLGTLVSKI